MIDLELVRDQVAASIRAEMIILAYTPGMTGPGIMSAAIRDATLWVERGIEAAMEKSEKA